MGLSLSASHFIDGRPFGPFELFTVHVLLLGTDDTAGTDDAHEGDGFGSREAVFPDKIGADEGSCTSKACFALETTMSLVHVDRILRTRSLEAIAKELEDVRAQRRRLPLK